MFSSTAKPQTAHRHTLSRDSTTARFITKTKSIFDMKELMRPDISKFLITNNNQPPPNGSQPEKTIGTSLKTKKGALGSRGIDLARCISEIQASAEPLQAGRYLNKEIQTTLEDGPLLEKSYLMLSNHRRLYSVGSLPLTAKSNTPSIFFPTLGARISIDLGSIPTPDLTTINSPKTNIPINSFEQRRSIKSRNMHTSSPVNNNDEDLFLETLPLSPSTSHRKKAFSKAPMNQKWEMATYSEQERPRPLYVQGITCVTARKKLKTAAVPQRPGKIYRTLSRGNLKKTQADTPKPVRRASPRLLVTSSKSKEPSYPIPSPNLTQRTERKKQALPLLLNLFSP